MASSQALEVFLRLQWAPRTFQAVQTPLGEQQTGNKFLKPIRHFAGYGDIVMPIQASNPVRFRLVRLIGTGRYISCMRFHFGVLERILGPRKFWSVEFCVGYFSSLV